MSENPHLADANSSGNHPTRRSWGCVVFAGVVSASCAGLPFYGVGYIVGSHSNDVNRGNQYVAAVNRIIAASPDRFDHLEINRGPADKFLIVGTVEQQEDLDILRDELIRAFGENRTDYVLAVELKDNDAGD